MTRDWLAMVGLVDPRVPFSCLLGVEDEMGGFNSQPSDGVYNPQLPNNSLVRPIIHYRYITSHHSLIHTW